MRRAVAAAMLALFSAVFWAAVESPDARVSGKCKDCHSMHAESPSPHLTKGGCLGCHAMNPEGKQNIVFAGRARIPQVLHNMENGDLAGGNFYYVADGFAPDYSKGHNVLGISKRQPAPRDVPPGFMRSVPIPGGVGPLRWLREQQLTCAGTWGCHGNRTIADPYKSMQGAHHEDDSVIDGTTVGRSYRFLYGVLGAEHRDWEYLATIDNHNGYRGDKDHVSMDTISYFCGQCHGEVHPHAQLGGVNPLIMAQHTHLTDIAFSAVKGGYEGSEFQAYVVYDLFTPVAYMNPKGNEKVVDADSIVMCLSCHRPHATPYQQMLRWDYSKMFAGSGESVPGCKACHTGKLRR
ncbi:MAG: cytochrome c3 family protein [Nitrospirota bacterium]